MEKTTEPASCIIAITPTEKKRLQDIGKFGERYHHIIKRLLDFWEKEHS